MMNLLDILRRSRLLNPNPQIDNSDHPISSGIMDAGKPPDDLSSIPLDPVGQPKALPTDTSNGDNLLDLFRQTENHPAMDAYKDYVAKPPVRDDPSTGRRILAALAGFAGGASRTDPNAATEILDAPYKQKVEDYNLHGKGLQEAAQLEHLTSTDKIKTFTEMRAEQKLEQDHQDALRRADQADTKEERQRLRDEEMSRHNSEMEKTSARLAGASERRANASEYKAENPTVKELPREHFVGPDGTDEVWTIKDGKKYEKIGDAKLGQNSQEIVNASKAVRLHVARIKDQLSDPETANEMGSILSGSGGSWEAFQQKLRNSSNEKLSKLATDFGLLEGMHTKVLGMRGSVAGMEALDRMFKLGIGTNLQQALGSLDSIDENARDNFEIRVPGEKKTEMAKPNVSRFTVVERKH